MQRKFRHGLTIAAAMLMAVPAAAADLISFFDDSPATRYRLGMDAYGHGGSVGWDQTGDFRDVTLSVAVVALVPGTTGSWSLYRQGTGVVASGQYLAPPIAGIDTFDFNAVPMTQLATGLRLTAGSYGLALFGPVGPMFGDSAQWIGDYKNWSANLAPGFSLSRIASSVYDPIVGPVFIEVGSELTVNFSLTGTAVPEPASWAMLIAGFGLTGAAMRRRRSTAAAI
ncbi:MAG: hypothetical protein RL490_2723 [Pseudomonadota bacterium]